MKMTISYSTRVRRYKDIEIRVYYKSHKSRMTTSITSGIVNSEGYGENDIKFKWYKIWKFNWYMLRKNEEKANKLLDELLEIAKVERKDLQ